MIVQDRVVRDTACSTSCQNSGILGTLTVHVQNATNLPDTDGAFSGDPDPFTRVTAIRQDTSLTRITRDTRRIRGTENPVWNQALSFGCGQWRFIEVSVWDSDSGGDDELIPIKLFPICKGGRCSITYVSSHQATLKFDIELTPRQDQNDCSPNPCLNGGTCVDKPCGFQCECTFGYEGSRCEDQVDFLCGGGNQQVELCP